MKKGDRIKLTKPLSNYDMNTIYVIDDIDFDQYRGYVYRLTDLNSNKLVVQLDDEFEKYFELADPCTYNIGSSDYSKHDIQPWDIWEEYHLNPWDADIIKRILRIKEQSGKSANESRIEDYNKIIHICQKRIEQIQKCYEF